MGKVRHCSEGRVQRISMVTSMNDTVASLNTTERGREKVKVKEE